MSVRVRLSIGIAAAAGSLALLTLPSLGAARGGSADASTYDAAPIEERPRDAGADAFVLEQIPADPPPLVTHERWLFDLRWDRGTPRLVEVRRADLAVKKPTPRVFGRFALELFEGKTLIERVRFDFPLLGASSDPKSVDLERRLSTRIGVFFPHTARGTRLELWDRATGKRWQLPWPPEATNAH